MTIIEIQKFPTCVDRIPEDSSGVHESVLRSYHIVGKVKQLLADGAPPKVVLELIEEMES